MKNDDIARLEQHVLTIQEPESLWVGLRLPKTFALPDNILVFYHDFTAAAPNAHGRYTLVVPLDRMTYFIEQMQFELEPGNVMLIPPHALRYLHPASAGYRRLFITFELSQRQEYIPGNLLNGLNSEAWDELWGFLADFRGNQPEKCAWKLYRLLRKLSAAPEVSGGAILLPMPIARAIEFMEKNLTPPVGVPDVAEYAGLSESHLRALFRKYLGITPGRYLQRQRIDAAKYHLLHTNRSIAEIAENCGFANVFVFGATFRKCVGIPPARFRKQR
ncbi:HTH-type transcriptional activator RhaR [bioreactor metagenome]|uniref:HTH-type transcriptional activator RhaR n=1 Tax=bioreactor metagenome TaxID=1076179 RepID=A0A645CZC1_9ZZZZ